VLVEEKLCKWLTAGLARYAANPLMVESVFFDMSQIGFPSFTGPGVFADQEKSWVPNEYEGGTLRWAGEAFAILGNTADELVIAGDASALENVDALPYQIVPPAVHGLLEFLKTEKFSVLSSFAQVPTQMPAITIRLERDAQADTYLGENLEHYGVDGTEFDIRSQALTGSYLLSIWSQNREATLWMYALLMTMALESMATFATWGLYDITLSGSDLDPALQYLAERTYTRHLLFTATRVERAISTRDVEWVSDFCVKVFAQYARLATTIPAME
jgi:hypothetical protein